jgi:NitT/TauT family transport system substrate-binding protein
MSLRAVAAVLLALLAGGCGGADEDAPPGDPSPAGPTRLTVQETTGAPAAFVAFGIERGTFARHGLEVVLETTQGGAATLPALLSGEVDVGGSNVVSLLLAASKGLPVRAIAGGTTARGTGEEDFGALLGAEGVTRIRDLDGGTVAVNTLNNVAEVAVKAALERRGLEPDAVEFAEVPFDGMAAALGEGSVDAALAIEPFATEARQAGHAVLGHPYAETEPGMQVGAYAVASRFADAAPETVEAFRAAIADTADEVASDEDAFRAFLAGREDLPPRLADAIALPRWTGALDAGSVARTARLMRRYGLVEQRIDTGRLLPSG